MGNAETPGITGYEDAEEGEEKEEEVVRFAADFF